MKLFIYCVVGFFAWLGFIWFVGKMLKGISEDYPPVVDIETDDTLPVYQRRQNGSQSTTGTQANGNDDVSSDSGASGAGRRTGAGTGNDG